MISKRFLFGQVGFIFIYLLIVSYISADFQQKVSETFRLYPYIIFGQFAYVPVGILLGVENMVLQWKTQGKIKWRLTKVLLFIVPSTYILIVPFLLPFDSFLPVTMITNPAIMPVIQVLLGYTLASSFYKIRE